MYVLFRRAAFEPYWIESVHAHLVDAIKRRDEEPHMDNEIQYWHVEGDNAIREVVDPIDYTLSPLDTRVWST